MAQSEQNDNLIVVVAANCSSLMLIGLLRLNHRLMPINHSSLRHGVTDSKVIREGGSVFNFGDFEIAGSFSRGF